MLGSAAAVLDADRADLDLEAVLIEEDAVVVDRLGVKDFAEMSYPIIPPIRMGRTARRRSAVLVEQTQRHSHCFFVGADFAVPLLYPLVA
jgi:hypothetical protein